MKKSPIRFLIFNFSFLILLFVTSGCVSLMTRLNVHSTSREPFYSGVCEAAKISTTIPSSVYEGDWDEVFPLLPCLVLSFPLDVAFDTVCFPFDLYIYIYRATVKKERSPQQSQTSEIEWKNR
jgi:uncharacterized protein YceK